MFQNYCHERNKFLRRISFNSGMKVYLHVNGASSGCIGCEKSLRPAQQV